MNTLRQRFEEHPQGVLRHLGCLLDQALQQLQLVGRSRAFLRDGRGRNIVVHPLQQRDHLPESSIKRSSSFNSSADLERSFEMVAGEISSYIRFSSAIISRFVCSRCSITWAIAIALACDPMSPGLWASPGPPLSIFWSASRLSRRYAVSEIIRSIRFRMSFAARSREGGTCGPGSSLRPPKGTVAAAL